MRVPLVEGVDAAFGGDLNLVVCQDVLSDKWVQGKSINARSDCEDLREGGARGRRTISIIRSL